MKCHLAVAFTGTVHYLAFFKNCNGLILHVYSMHCVFKEMAIITPDFLSYPENNLYLHFYSAYVSVYMYVKITSSHITSFSVIKSQGLLPLKLLGGRR